MGSSLIGTFGERLAEAVRRNDSLLCIGLDPDPVRLPAEMQDSTDLPGAIVAFNAAVVDATADLVCAYKPNLAFYLAHGAAGIAALEATRRRIPEEIPVILDAKFGDVASTCEGYATAAFDTWGFDAVTVNPYLGEDALAPFLRRGDRGTIVLSKTSNPGSADFQDLDIANGGASHRTLALTVAERVQAWTARWPATLGLVVGATYPGELAEVRRSCPDLPILLPGIGAQGGDLEGSLRAGLTATGQGLIVNASRGVIYAGGDEARWIDAVRAEASRLREAIDAVRDAEHQPAPA